MKGKKNHTPLRITQKVKCPQKISKKVSFLVGKLKNGAPIGIGTKGCSPIKNNSMTNPKYK